ncbi:MAG: hypothetical protein ACLTKG_07850 [Collinsella intestinalis]
MIGELCHSTAASDAPSNQTRTFPKSGSLAQVRPSNWSLCIEGLRVTSFA